MSSYYDDPELGDVYRERDEEAVAWAIEERERNEEHIVRGEN